MELTQEESYRIAGAIMGRAAMAGEPLQIIRRALPGYVRGYTDGRAAICAAIEKRLHARLKNPEAMYNSVFRRVFSIVVSEECAQEQCADDEAKHG